MSGWEENEISEKSKGGTELSKRMLQSSIDKTLLEEFQIIPSRIRDLKEDKIRIYHIHDLAHDPECAKLKDENMRNKFQKIVFVSNWQMNEFVTKLGMPFDTKLQVIENPIIPLELIEKEKNKVNLIYFSTPQRGLELLLPVVEALAKEHPEIHLNVFSSFKIYGWDDADKQFQPLYDKIQNHPNMTYHGFAEQDKLREYIQKSHILAYPSIWTETSCRVLIESMSAGLLCVHPNLGALSDTSGGLTFMYQFDQDPKKHVETFYKYMKRAIEDVNKPEVQNYLRFTKAFADMRFNADKISTQWESLLVELKQEYPDSESRKIPSEMFVYKV